MDRSNASIVTLPPAPEAGGIRTLTDYLLVMRGLARPQRIATPVRHHLWDGPFVLTEPMQRAWHDLFGAEAPAREIPFTYYSPLGVRMGHEALRLLGVNFKNILYVSWSMRVGDAARSVPDLGEPCRVVTEIESLTPKRNNRAILTLKGRLIDSEGRPLVTVRDSMMLKNVAQRDLDGLVRATGEALPTGPSRPLPEPARIDPSACRTVPLAYPDDIGRRYGELSGDTNFLHTNPYLLKLFGYDRTFAHGMCSANFVLKALAGDEGMRLRDFAIRFRKPVFLGQTVELRVGEGRFEICDGDDEVLARGEFSTFDGTRGGYPRH